MGKLALGVSASILKIFFTTRRGKVTNTLYSLSGNGVNSIFMLPTTMLERPECETDTRYVQVLPYVTLFKRDAGTGAKRYLTYKRPETGGEPRLHDLRSLGWGGHIETEVGVKNFSSVFLEEAAREIKEETGLDMSTKRISSALSGTGAIYYQPKDNVGKYHLCISLCVEVTAEDLETMTFAPDEAADVQWETKDEIEAAIANEGYTLEPWSELVLNSL